MKTFIPHIESWSDRIWYDLPMSPRGVAFLYIQEDGSRVYNSICPMRLVMRIYI